MRKLTKSSRKYMIHDTGYMTQVTGSTNNTAVDYIVLLVLIVVRVDSIIVCINKLCDCCVRKFQIS